MQTKFLYPVILGAAIGVTALLKPHTSFAASGSIEFIDEAPPPSQAQREEAERFYLQATEAQGRLQLLWNVLRALTSLEEQLKAHASGIPDTKDVSERLATWERDAKTVQALPNDANALNSLVKSTVGIAQLLKSTPKANPSRNDIGRVSDLHRATTIQMRRLFDEAVVEHGGLNQILRLYPYSALVKQPFVECDFINSHSTDFKCLPPDAKGTLSNSSWIATPSISVAEFCKTHDIENFSGDMYGKLITWVRRGSKIAPDKYTTRC